MLPLVPESSLHHVRWLGTFRYISLVRAGGEHYVYKSVERPETMKDWRREFTNLTRSLASSFIVDIVGIVTARYPYSPDGDDVVKGFLLEYGEGASLKEVMKDIPHLEPRHITKWALQIARGLQDLHQQGVVHG